MRVSTKEWPSNGRRNGPHYATVFLRLFEPYLPCSCSFLKKGRRAFTHTQRELERWREKSSPSNRYFRSPPRTSSPSSSVHAYPYHIDRCFPFTGPSYPELYKNISKGVFRVPESFSTSPLTLVRGMLVTDPTQRLTLRKVRKTNGSFNAVLARWIWFFGTLAFESYSFGSICCFFRRSRIG